LLIFSAACVALGGHDEGRPQPWRALEWSAWVAVGAWLLPAIEQATSHPGNVTLILRSFFLDGRTGQTFATAVRTWSSLLTGVARPGFALASGSRQALSGSNLPLFAAVIEIVLVVLIAVAGFRTGRRFLSTIGAVSAAASLVALWSCTRIYGEIVDHEVFWISAIGVVNLATIASALLTLARPIRLESRMPIWLRPNATP